MSRTRKAALTSGFLYSQYALGLVYGLVLFPVVVFALGAYDYGLWLASGEVVGYFLLGDLGVFAVMPWLVAGRDGAGDRAAIPGILSDGLAVGVVAGGLLLAAAAAVWFLDPAVLPVNPANWAKVRGPVALLLGLTGVGFPFKAFLALLVGLQDVTFIGLVNLGQQALTVGLTAALVLGGYGMVGLAVAAGLPPVFAGLAAAVRVWTTHRETAGLRRPRWAGCRYLIGQGLGPWVAGFGSRLLSASHGLIFAAAGRPDWGTMYAATGKAAQVAQPMCWVMPDSGVVGLGQLHGEGNPERTRRVVLCLLLLYLLVPGAAALALLAANPAFVRVWMGPEVYAGHYVSGLLAANLLLGSAVSGLFKVTAVAGYRPQVGFATLVYGALTFGLGLWLARTRGPAGPAEAAVLVALVLAIPLGVAFVARVYQIRAAELVTGWVGPWAVRTVPFLAAAAAIGVFLAERPLWYAAAAAAALGGLYVLAVRPVLASAPWPDQVRRWLAKARLVPRTTPS